MTRPYRVDASIRPLASPVPRGPLMTAKQIASELFGGSVSEKWVRAHAPHRVKLSHRPVLWYRNDVLQWIDDKRE